MKWNRKTNRTMKICHIVSGDLWAGAEAMVSVLLEGSKRFPELELSVIILNEGVLADRVRSLQIPLKILPEKEQTFFQLQRKIKKIIMESEPAIVHTHRYKENLLGYLATRKQKDVRLVATQHGLPEVYGAKQNRKHELIVNFNLALMKRKFSRVVAVSDDIYRFFLSRSFSENRLLTIRNGIKLPEKELRKDQSPEVIVGSAGRFFPVKDYPLMVNIAAKLKAVAGLKFHLIGEGPDRKTIDKSIHQHGLQKKFWVRPFQENLTEFYRQIDIFINTSRHEGIPMSVLEAMAAGKPIIAPRVGGLEEIIDDGINGFLIDGREPQKFAEKCKLLADKPDLRTKMGEAARQKVEKSFSMVSMARAYYQLYRELETSAGR